MVVTRIMFMDLVQLPLCGCQKRLCVLSQVMLHQLGTSVSVDKCIYVENDPRFYVHVSHTKDWAYLIVASSSKMSSEVRTATDIPLCHIVIHVQEIVMCIYLINCRGIPVYRTK